jgi:hypothetical protein
VASGFNRNNGLLMNLATTMLWPMSRSVEKGAETVVWLATSADVVKTDGGYYVDVEWRRQAHRDWTFGPRGVSGRSARHSAQEVALKRADEIPVPAPGLGRR